MFYIQSVKNVTMRLCTYDLKTLQFSFHVCINFYQIIRLRLKCIRFMRLFYKNSTYTTSKLQWCIYGVCIFVVKSVHGKNILININYPILDYNQIT